MSASLRARTTTVLVVVAGFLVGGCASASKPAAMVPNLEGQSLHTSSATVSVQVAGGKETSSAGSPQIANADFAAAIQTAISDSKMFATVDDAGEYQLEAYLARLEQPIFGLSMTVTLEVGWKLMRLGETRPVWQESIETVYTATSGEAFAGVTRLRKANEGAARENIARALRRIAELKLP